MEIVPKKIETLWETWDLRTCILLSLFLQAFLVLFSSFRQRFKSTLLIFFIWAAYLLADWIAAFAIGLITESQGNNSDSDAKGNGDLLAFWASFLLLHLGGPDSITSFAMEDNEFWIRHRFGLLLQVLAAAYSILLTLPNNKLWLPTILVFVVGTTKYAERTYALYLASLDCFGTTVLPIPDPGPDDEESAALHAAATAVMPRVDQFDDAPLIADLGDMVKVAEDIKLLQLAHLLFEAFKGLIVGFFLTNRDRKTIREIFMKIDHTRAFKLIEYEFSFMYQVLHTKAVVVHRRVGYILRFISLSSILGASIFFFLVGKKSFGTETEIALTFTLLVGAIVLDVISIIKFIFSEWTLLDVQIENQYKWRKEYITKRILKKKRWSGKVYQYNMIDYCLGQERQFSLILDKIAGYVRATAIVEQLRNMWFSSSKPVEDPLKESIFEELKEKSRAAKNLKEACSQRGDSALFKSSYSSYIMLKWSIGEFQYAESLLLWHLATDLILICYKEDDESNSDDAHNNDVSSFESNIDSDSDRKQQRENRKKQRENRKRQRENCKALSDYVFYLLVMHTTMMSPVLGNWHKAFQDTCAEAKRFFEKHKITNYEDAFKNMDNVKIHMRPAAVKETKSKSVFFAACILATQLRSMEESERWKTMEQVWLEFVAYAAINCQANIHAQQPSRGGELLSFIWLLMYHLGLGTQFSDQEEHAVSNLK